MPPTEQDPIVVWLKTGAEWALGSVRGSERRDKICRLMSGWFAQQSQAESEAVEFETMRTPMLPPPDEEIPVTEVSSIPPAPDDD